MVGFKKHYGSCSLRHSAVQWRVSYLFNCSYQNNIQQSKRKVNIRKFVFFKTTGSGVWGCGEPKAKSIHKVERLENENTGFQVSISYWFSSIWTQFEATSTMTHDQQGTHFLSGSMNWGLNYLTGGSPPPQGKSQPSSFGLFSYV